MADVVKTVHKFREYVKKIMHYREALSLMYWDLRTGAPKKGVPLRSEAIGTLSAEAFHLSTSAQMEAYLQQLSEPGTYDTLDRVTQATVRELRREFERSKKIPADRYKAYVVLTSQAESVWEEAKHTNNFGLFRPYLEQLVAMNIEFVGYWGYTENKYDTLLDAFEPGITVKQLDRIFGDLRTETVELVKRIVASGKKSDVSPFLLTFEKDKQRQLSVHMLQKIGYDFGAGRLDETVHPFENTVNRYDVRVTTKYVPNDLRSALFGTIHEGGHALYEQGISPDLIDTPLCGGASMGIHESQSLFWENVIGRSRAFWESHYGELQAIFPSQFGQVSLDSFYRGINHVEPSLIRIEADEVTYNLHIMIRYEIEKGLINETLQVKDLPEIWREKMHDYLGIVPETDAEGVLQDVHWASGDFGYFPSYALGNIYAAQFRNTLAKDIPDYMDQVRNDELTQIKRWLNDNVHRHGKMLTPGEIVRQVTGEEVDAKYLVQYLHEKFSPIYGL